MSKEVTKDLREINFLGQHFLDKTKSFVGHAKEEERKAKQSEKKALRVKRQTQDLMNRIIPRELVAQLSNGISVQPKVYEDITICVSSIVDYDSILSSMDAIQVSDFERYFGMLQDVERLIIMVVPSIKSAHYF